jgi:hypothetical protein
VGYRELGYLPTTLHEYIVDSGSVSQNVQAHGREVVPLVRVERPSRFVNSLPNRVLRFGGKGPQDPRDRRRRLGEIAPVR